MKKIITFLISTLFPRECLLCSSNKNLYLCPKCLQSLKMGEAYCFYCQRESHIGEFCNNCQGKNVLTGIMVASNFEDPKVKKLINAFKYGFIKELAYPLGVFLFSFFERRNKITPFPNNRYKIFNNNNSLILAAPLSRKRYKWRGFNQSELLAKIISEKSNIKFSNNLIKTKNTKNQAQLNLKEREENLKNCFSFADKSLAKKEIKNKKIIIIDDVSTTGNTLNEIAKEIKKYQPREIWGLVIAHSL